MSIPKYQWRRAKMPPLFLCFFFFFLNSLLNPERKGQKVTLLRWNRWGSGSARREGGLLKHHSATFKQAGDISQHVESEGPLLSGTRRCHVNNGCDERLQAPGPGGSINTNSQAKESWSMTSLSVSGVNYSQNNPQPLFFRSCSLSALLWGLSVCSSAVGQLSRTPQSNESQTLEGSTTGRKGRGMQQFWSVQGALLWQRSDKCKSRACANALSRASSSGKSPPPSFSTSSSNSPPSLFH